MKCVHARARARTFGRNNNDARNRGISPFPDTVIRTPLFYHRESLLLNHWLYRQRTNNNHHNKNSPLPCSAAHWTSPSGPSTKHLEGSQPLIARNFLFLFIKRKSHAIGPVFCAQSDSNQRKITLREDILTTSTLFLLFSNFSKSFPTHTLAVRNCSSTQPSRFTVLVKFHENGDTLAPFLIQFYLSCK
ncbi:uncharacterized protein LOC143425715 [Xylocopa sonorina]|uniref:uncharacterized protein LOC143425715 n=1 Tax=Xylocopa sonorina TaxID=1818115 RepID=UPI00403AB8AC